MRANQPMPEVKSRGHARRAPLCYSRQTPRDKVEQTRIYTESSALIAVYSVVRGLCRRLPGRLWRLGNVIAPNADRPIGTSDVAW